MAHVSCWHISERSCTFSKYAIIYRLKGPENQKFYHEMELRAWARDQTSSSIFEGSQTDISVFQCCSYYVRRQHLIHQSSQAVLADQCASLLFSSYEAFVDEGAIFKYKHQSQEHHEDNSIIVEIRIQKHYLFGSFF